jgi:hypothetical protein
MGDGNNVTAQARDECVDFTLGRAALANPAEEPGV